MAGPGGISCWGPNASVHRGDFAAESSFSRKAQPKSDEAAPCWLPGRPAHRDFSWLLAPVSSGAPNWEFPVWSRTRPAAAAASDFCGGLLNRLTGSRWGGCFRGGPPVRYRRYARPRCSRARGGGGARARPVRTHRGAAAAGAAADRGRRRRGPSCGSPGPPAAGVHPPC
jgi:hypothetical protein